AWTCYRIGDSYLQKRSFQEALAWLRSSVTIAPYQLDFRIRLAKAQYDAGLIQEAMVNYDFLLEENPKQPAVLVNYGYLLLTEEKQLQRADSMYAAAVKLDPDYIQALINLAGTRYLLGDVVSARKHINRILQLDATNRQAMAMYKALSTTHR
ncbi:MAG: tetratricopeptide repeat protein, partial [Flavobacteriales bacterium]